MVQSKIIDQSFSSCAVIACSFLLTSSIQEQKDMQSSYQLISDGYSSLIHQFLPLSVTLRLNSHSPCSRSVQVTLTHGRCPGPLGPDSTPKGPEQRRKVSGVGSRAKPGKGVQVFVVAICQYDKQHLVSALNDMNGLLFEFGHLT